MKIAFIGNFVPPYSTENERKKAFEELGHTVVTYQENQTTAEQLIENIFELDLLLYSHTHDPSYIIAGLKEVFGEYKLSGVPTASAHLDRWLGLTRESDMGQEATWFTEYIFMADGSPEAAQKYKDLGLNWYYLKPAVSKSECYLAKPDHEIYPHEIVFTGSKGYHPEYPFRRELVDWLTETYGDKFGHYGNDGIRVVRQGELNALYASAKIVVGNSCFGGRPNYVSDRYYEVRGRGGFLIHPHTEGVDTVGVGHYDKQNLESLKRTINYYLETPHEIESNRLQGFEWVKNNETYTDRAREMLKIMGLR